MAEYLMGFTDKDSQNHNETADQKVISLNVIEEKNNTIQ